MKRLLSKRTAILTVLLGAVVSLIGWSQNWLTLHLSSADIRVNLLDITGQGATALPAGLALVALATGLVLLTAHRILAYVIGVINIAVGAGLVALCLSVVADPVSFVFKQLSSLSGIADQHALRLLVSSVALGFGLWVCLVGGVLIVAGSLFTLFGAHTWLSRRSRYEVNSSGNVNQTNAKSSDNDGIQTIDAWDEMTRGDDPTS